jgi:hypothetical protein
VGELLMNLLDGEGEFTWPNGDRYRGGYVNGRRHADQSSFSYLHVCCNGCRHADHPAFHIYMSVAMVANTLTTLLSIFTCLLNGRRHAAHTPFHLYMSVATMMFKFKIPFLILLIGSIDLFVNISLAS